jgi:hypothetical protein
LAQFCGVRLKIFAIHINNSEIHPENIFRGVRLVLRLSMLQATNATKLRQAPIRYVQA